ncbi:MAG: cytidine deaminase [Peptococcaceae bacterium]|nr:cytidine deaminase [Peptococcaceae bacterium]
MLVERAREALPAAYAKYSHYCVGAAVLWSSGRVTQGCNIENASYGLSVCAERVALFTGVAQGERCPQALAVAVEAPDAAFPCGACLQVMAEWARGLPIYLTNAQGEVQVTDLELLLPQAFGLTRAAPASGQ